MIEQPEDRVDAEVRALLSAPTESPFSEAEHTAMRRAVLDELGRRADAPALWPLFLRAASALALVGALALAIATWSRRPAVAPVTAQRPVPRPAPILAPAPSPAAAIESAPAAPVRVARAAPLARTPRRAVARRLHPPGPGAGVPVRIEIQTADPNIRIIWLANSAGTNEPSLAEGS